MFAQLCVEDLAIDVKLKDKKYIQSQMRCVLGDNNDFCDPFGLKLKRKLILLAVRAQSFTSLMVDLRQDIN